MVDLVRDDDPPGPILTGFTPRGFVLGERRFEDGLWLTPREAMAWAAPALDDLDTALLDELLDISPVPEFLLLGTGENLVHPPRHFVASLEERGIGVEPMGSKAAARAWSLLRQEERWIVAALLPFA